MFTGYQPKSRLAVGLRWYLLSLAMALNDCGANAASVSFGGSAPQVFAVAAEDATLALAQPAEGTAAANSMVRSRNLANAFSGPTQNQALLGSSTPAAQLVHRWLAMARAVMLG